MPDDSPPDVSVPVSRSLIRDLIDLSVWTAQLTKGPSDPGTLAVALSKLDTIQRRMMKAHHDELHAFLHMLFPEHANCFQDEEGGACNLRPRA